ncbi:hypothetical protein B296_00004791 [Ensete ventricosum]|uniref:Uncharacterized protein n=1 Tax=Ensete ventricosum TaxID=4639 RepID=A0A426ZI72_ENSVE|nr:hypothetical protein B296_00004791 [Ensete ventricosum]
MLRPGVTREWVDEEGLRIQGVNAMVPQRRVFRVCASNLALDENGVGGNRRRKMGSSYSDLGLEGYGIWLLLGSTVGVKEDYDDSVLGGIIRAIGELDYFSAYIRLREPDKSEDKADVANRARWAKLDPCPKQSQVGYKCKLARKLLEPLMRSATTNKTSVKLGILASGGCAI